MCFRPARCSRRMGIRTISVPPSGSVWTLNLELSPPLSRSVAQTVSQPWRGSRTLCSVMRTDEGNHAC
jgi:hypothetical protein